MSFQESKNIYCYPVDGNLFQPIFSVYGMEPPKTYPICASYNYEREFSKIPKIVSTDLTMLVRAVGYWFDGRDLRRPTKDRNKRNQHYLCARCETFKLSFVELERPVIPGKDD